MRFVACVIAAVVFGHTALAQTPSTPTVPPLVMAKAQYAAIIDCVLDKLVGHSFNSDPKTLIPKLLTACQSRVDDWRAALAQRGYAPSVIAETEATMRDMLVAATAIDFDSLRKDAEPERAFARSIYNAAVLCASKVAIDYKELGAGDPTVFFQFINGQCTFGPEIEAAAKAGYDFDDVMEAGLAAKSCGFAKALTNLKHPLDTETADLYELCPAFVETINERPPT